MVYPCSDRISRVPPYSRTTVCITCTGLSPAAALFSKSFHLSHCCHWPGPRSLATTYGVSVDVLSSGYLDVSVPRVCSCSPMYSGTSTWLTPLSIAVLQSEDHNGQTTTECQVGSPIRKSPDQSLFATPRGLSQRITSFIACACQGIHRTPLFHLIVLIANAHPFGSLNSPD